MKPSFTIVCIALTLLLNSMLTPFTSTIPVAQAAGSEPMCYALGGTGKITGTVTAAGGGPLQYVQITAYTAHGDRVTSASTNIAGVYQINNLIAGNYIIEFRPNSGNTMSEWYGNQPTALTATPVTVSDGATTSGINAVLDPGAQFLGLVRGADGSSIQSVLVTVYDSEGRQVASDYTDSSGNFLTQPGLRMGSYRIGFSQAYDFIDSFYNDKASLDEAEPLLVSGSGIIPNINPILARGGVITGKVTDAATGLPIVSSNVSAYSNNDGGYDYTDASGTYTITGLMSGSYSISAGPFVDTSNLIREEQTTIVTASQTTSNVNFQLSAGGTLSGRVSSAGIPLKDIVVYISDDTGDYQNYVITNASGIYTTTALPSGEYTVFFRPTSYIPEYYNDHKVDAGQRDRVIITAPNTVTGIDAELAPGSSISGKVVDADTNLPLQGIFVEILNMQGRRVETATTAADGSYTSSTSLASGSYLVRFNADNRNTTCAYVTEYYSDSLTMAGATPVQVVAPNIVTGINGALSRGSIIFGKLSDEATAAPITGGIVRVSYPDGTFARWGRLNMFGGYHTETALPSGNYIVMFDDNDNGYIDEYYDNQLTKEAANLVTLSAPTNIYNINAALRKGALISGQVKAADTGLPFTDGYVIVYDLVGNEIAGASLEDDGSYLVSAGLAPGDYLVAAMPYSFEGSEVTSLLPAQGIPAPARSSYVLSFHGGAITTATAKKVTITTATTISGIDISMLHGVWLPGTMR